MNLIVARKADPRILQTVVHPNGKVIGLVQMNQVAILINVLLSVKFYVKVKVRIPISLVPLH